MNEIEAVSKMKELKESIETMFKYYEVSKKFPLLLITFLLGILATGIILIIIDYIDYLNYSIDLQAIPFPYGDISAGIFIALLWIIISIVIYMIIKSAFNSRISLNWNEDLEEGAIGILKILEREDWGTYLLNLKKAKVSFMVLSILQFILYWVLATVLLLFLEGFIVVTFNLYNINIYLVSVISLIIILAFGDKYIKETYQKLWKMDSLISDLRWFFLEFQNLQL